MKIEKIKDLPQEYVDDWARISCELTLSEDFIRDHKDKVDWEYISNYQKLSEAFISEFKDKVNWWSEISEYQELSEDFIRDHQDKVDWENISAYQKLSESFIIEFKDKVDWEYINVCQKLSEDFIKEFSLVIPKYNILNIVHYCGKLNRVIYILKEDPNRIHIGCGKFTKEEAIAAINKKYVDNEALDYIDKVNECFNLK